MKKSKLLFTLSIASLAVVPFAVSCSFDSKNDLYAKTDVAGIASLFKEKEQEVQAAINTNHTKQMNVVLMTAGGKVDDLSFNQSVWEAVSQFSEQTKNEMSSYVTPLNDSAVSKQYDNLIISDKNVWILTGFQHGYLFRDWLTGGGKNDENLNTFAKSDIVVVGIDWVLEGLTKEQQEKIEGKIINLNYKTEEAGWMAGYAAANYLGAKFPGMSQEQRAKRGIAAFGGGPGKGVTDFITGFLSGIKKFNSEAENADKKALITSTPISLDSGFDTQDASKIELVKNITITNNPAIILPVAGPFTSSVVQAVKASGANQSIIGVDTDQSKSFVDDKNIFFTSIEKRLGATVYRVLVDLFIKKESSDIIGDFNKMPKNRNVKLGFWDGFTSLSKTSKEGEEQKMAQDSIDKAINKFKEIVPKEKKEQAIKLLNITEMSDTPKDGKTFKEYNETVLNKLITEINK